MASSIASPVPRSHVVNRSMRKEITTLKSHEDGRGTPLPQYEKTQSVPFTLTLQEEKDKPGQFQLVVNVDPQHSKGKGDHPLKPTPSKKLVASLQEAPSLGYDVSQLYHTQKSSPPSTPQEDRQGWSDLDAIPSEFLEKVVPDWKVTFSRSDSTASTQSRKLADIKARIKKSGKGFVVRLLKGSNADTNEVAEVHLGNDAAGQLPTVSELDSSAPPVELDTVTPTSVAPNHGSNPVFEIGSSGEPGVVRPAQSGPSAAPSSIPQWISQLSRENPSRFSMHEDNFSDAETLLPEVRSIADRLEDRVDFESISTRPSALPTRSTSIVKTPTRGLSVVGPVRRVEKGNRTRAKGKTARVSLNRSGARKSFIGRSPQGSISESTTEQQLRDAVAAVVAPVQERQSSSSSSDESSGESSSQDFQDIHRKPRRTHSDKYEATNRKTRRQPQSNETAPSAQPKASLRLHTNVPPVRSANTSPISNRKRSPRTKKPTSTLPLNQQATDSQSPEGSPVWTEIKPDDAEQVREAFERQFGTVPDELESPIENTRRSIPRIEKPVREDDVGKFDLPPSYELHSPPKIQGNRFSAYFGLAFSAVLDGLVDGLHHLRNTYGSEPPVPPGHVRVRWTCLCGEHLYDDFVERRPGAARWLEEYLNRPRTHTPSSPHSRSSTSTSMSSIFDNMSRTSTLATPSSTYSGTSPWGRSDNTSKYSPVRLQSSSSFSVVSRPPVEDSWLLTCANEGRLTPKIVHLDVNEQRIRSDRDLALVLRGHYEQLNRRWLKWTRLRGLTTIEFVQFEVHRNRFADIRAAPSMPPTSSSANDKSPSHHPYTFEPCDLMPPVGSKYLLHLFMHPEDYDEEQVTYKRSPKRRERLQFGMGWGINLVEGFQAQKVWAFIMASFGVGSAVFAILWTVRENDVQGAFGVAGWIVTLAALVLGALQAWLE